MNAVELVMGTLEAADYERLSKPLVVAGSKFDFDAAASGTAYSHDLVVVAQDVVDFRRLERLLSGLNRTLDQAESRRPVTLVLIATGASGQSNVVASLERHARVLILDSESPTQDDVRQAIAVLLPLTIPSTSSPEATSPLDEVGAALGASLSDEHRRFIDAAASGAIEVEKVLREFMDDAVRDSDEAS